MSWNMYLCPYEFTCPLIVPIRSILLGWIIILWLMITKSILGDKRFQNNVFHPTIDGLNDKNEK